jgi:hypothetical protein
MRTLGGFCFALLAATGLFAQNRSGIINPIPATQTFGSVLFPAGTSALPGVQRFAGSVLHPGGSGPQIAIPGLAYRPVAGQRPVRYPSTGVLGYPVAVPVYVGGYGYGYGYADGTYDPNQPPAPAAPAAPAQPQQPNVIVVYPPAPSYGYPAAPPSNMVQVPPEQMEPSNQPAEPTHYLLAFKNRSIYSAIAYWVDGETIHYITSGNTHNQASLSLVDRDLTKKLNEGGLEVKLPPEK